MTGWPPPWPIRAPWRDREITMHDQQGSRLVLQWTFAPFYGGPTSST